jgi:hypothetical protein
MNPGTLPPLAAWQSFYVVLGSAAAALTGLQFVVMALVSNSRQTGSMREVDAFGTPTVVHFCCPAQDRPWVSSGPPGSCTPWW